MVRRLVSIYRSSIWHAFTSGSPCKSIIIYKGLLLQMMSISQNDAVKGNHTWNTSVFSFPPKSPSIQSKHAKGKCLLQRICVTKYFHMVKNMIISFTVNIFKLVWFSFTISSSPKLALHHVSTNTKTAWVHITFNNI